MNKIDARRLSSDGRLMLRKMVIRLRQQAKMPLKELAAVAGVHVRTVEAWLLRARREGEGSLDGEKKRGRPMGSCRKLTMTDEMWLRDQIVGHTPGQMKLPFALWTRPAIKALVKARFTNPSASSFPGWRHCSCGASPCPVIMNCAWACPLRAS